MTPTKVYIEQGKAKTFASALDWPGWSRFARDEAGALQALFDYRARYKAVLATAGLEFNEPEEISKLVVVERHPGNSTTDFGAPAITPAGDKRPFDQQSFIFSRDLLNGCWQAFDEALESASGRELRKGPRGGGRDIEKIVNHVLEADIGYLSRIATRHRLDEEMKIRQQVNATRQVMLNALEIAVKEPLPEQGPRGGVIWPAHYLVRRTAWHVLDHAWEIEDRLI
jgi:hypothetical protein